MKEFFRKIYYSIIKHFPDRMIINFENIRAYKRVLPKEKENIKFFGEKIQWLKLYGNMEKYTKYVDKYKVREYVENKIGKEYLIPLINVYDKTDDINYEELPNKFVLKLNHGSAYNIICNDKSKFNIKKANKKLNKWLKEDYYRIKKEYQYKNVEKKIVCEKFMSNKNGELIDYKFFCFDGKPHFLKIDIDRFTEHKINFYDMDFQKINLREDKFKNFEGEVEKPKKFDKMIEIATELSKDFQFVRVDLYNIDGNIYFGELTFTPASGKNPFFPLSKDLEIAKGIELSNEKD